MAKKRRGNDSQMSNATAKRPTGNNEPTETGTTETGTTDATTDNGPTRPNNATEPKDAGITEEVEESLDAELGKHLFGV